MGAELSMDWPKQPDGAVDWMSVFQAPKTGLIALIDGADTSEKLQTCFIFVIDSLFSRDDDEEVRQTYYDIAEEAFQGAADEKALAAQKVKIRMVMMRVMNDRIMRSREHMASKAAEGDVGDAQAPEDNRAAAS